MRAGIVGAGFMGQVHARAVRASGGTVSRVLGSSPESTRHAVDVLGATAASGSIEGLVADDEVDVVHVCTPNAFHTDMVAAALTAGKPVICEKPLSTTLRDARRMLDLATEADVVATIPFVYRFYPMVREARARVPSVLPLLVIHGSYLQDWLADPGATNWRVDPAVGGASRAFADIGVHWFDLIEFVSGDRVERLVARTFVAHDRQSASTPGAISRTEDAVCVLFETAGGATGSAVISQVSSGRRNRLSFSLDGVGESIAFDQEHPEQLWLGTPGDNRIVQRGSGGLSATENRLSVLPAGHPQGYQDCFNAFVADSYALMSGEHRDGVPTFADGVRAALLTDCVLESARTNEWVSVADVDAQALSSPAIRRSALGVGGR